MKRCQGWGWVYTGNTLQTNLKEVTSLPFGSAVRHCIQQHVGQADIMAYGPRSSQQRSIAATQQEFPETKNKVGQQVWKVSTADGSIASQSLVGVLIIQKKGHGLGSKCQMAGKRNHAAI